jgi:SAM-dependent methyltransferase
MSSRNTWESRHARSSQVAPPSAFVARRARSLVKNRTAGAAPPLALDLAAGAGRHSIYLRTLGYRVVALDFSRNALGAIAGEEPSVCCVQADALALPFDESTFDLIVQTRFLERAIFGPLARLLRPGGHLLVETFGVGQHERTGHPRREFCLEPGELVRLCCDAGLEVLEEPEPGDPAEMGGPVLESAVAVRP